MLQRIGSLFYLLYTDTTGFRELFEIVFTDINDKLGITCGVRCNKLRIEYCARCFRFLVHQQQGLGEPAGGRSYLPLGEGEFA